MIYKELDENTKKVKDITERELRHRLQGEYDLGFALQSIKDGKRYRVRNGILNSKTYYGDFT